MKWFYLFILLVPAYCTVVLQYCSCFVTRDSTDLHQLSGKNLSNRLTLQECIRKIQQRLSQCDRKGYSRFTNYYKIKSHILRESCYLVFQGSRVELCKGDKWAAGGFPFRSSGLHVTRSISFQFSGAVEQCSILEEKLCSQDKIKHLTIKQCGTPTETDLIKFLQVSGHDCEVGSWFLNILNSLHKEVIYHLEHTTLMWLKSMWKKMTGWYARCSIYPNLLITIFTLTS